MWVTHNRWNSSCMTCTFMLRLLPLNHCDSGWTGAIFDFKHVTFSCLTRVHPSRKQVLSQSSPSHWLSAAGEGEAAAMRLLWPAAEDVKCNFALPTQSYLFCPFARTVSLFTAEGELCLKGVGGRLLWRAPQTTWKWLNQHSSLSNNQHPLSHTVDEMLPLAPSLLTLMVEQQIMVGDELFFPLVSISSLHKLFFAVYLF